MAGGGGARPPQNPPAYGGNILEDLSKTLDDIVTNPEKFKEYQKNLAIYAYNQARVFGYKGTIKQFLDSLGLSKVGTGIVDKLTKSGVAGGPYHVDFKKGHELATDPGLWKIPTAQEEKDMKKRVAALKRSYDVVKRLGFNGSYTSFVKKIDAVEKLSFTFPGFGGG